MVSTLSLLVCFLPLLLLVRYLIVVPNVAENNLLDVLNLRDTTPGYTCRLFTNNYTPIATTVLGDLTEAVFMGYLAQPLAGAAASTTSGGKGSTTWNTLTFTNNSGAPVTVYGYYITDTANTKLFWAERDPAAPITINASGGHYYVTPALTLASEN